MLLAAGLISIAALPWLIELALFRKKILLLLWWILIPLSVPLAIGDSKISPSEIFLLFWLALPLWHGLPSRFAKVLQHPISILLMLEVAAYAFSTLTSSMVLVSLKRFILHSIYIFGAFFLFTNVFAHRQSIIKMIYSLSVGLFPVLISAMIFLAGYGFNSEVAPEGPRPFFSDHTEFGAFASLLFPIHFVLCWHGKDIGHPFKNWQKTLLVISLLAVIFSFSRAVWASMAAVFLLYALIRMGLRFRQLIFIIAIGCTVLYSYSDELYQVVLQNEAQSSQQEVLEQLKSVGNVKTDVSNLERINRWKSAIAMFQERPLLGFGPGTYQFQYAPYQELRDKTVISTNFGDAGNAHSEYLMYLSETGILGFLTFMGICFYILYLGFKIYRKAADSQSRFLALGLLLSFAGLLVHSLFNSFLETDKIGLLFYMFLAALVALDIQNSEEKRLFEVS